MEPELKAKEIWDSVHGFRVKRHHKLKCALLVAESAQNEGDQYIKYTSYNMVRFKYWEKVREEINKIYNK